MFDYSRLRGKIRENGATQDEVGAAAKMSAATFSQKINGKSEFKQSEISAICAFLEIEPKDLSSYFFTPRV